MRNIAVLSENSLIVSAIESTCKEFADEFNPVFFRDEPGFIQYLNYELPEIDIIDFSDESREAGEAFRRHDDDSPRRGQLHASALGASVRHGRVEKVQPRRERILDLAAQAVGGGDDANVARFLLLHMAHYEHLGHESLPSARGEGEHLAACGRVEG